MSGPTCDTCRFWGTHPNVGYRTRPCFAVLFDGYPDVQEEDAESFAADVWEDDPEREAKIARWHAIKATLAGDGAHRARLATLPTFGCNLHETRG